MVISHDIITFTREVNNLERISNIAQRLKEYRERFGLTLSEVSKKCKIPMQTLSRYELEQRVPKIDTAVEIAESLGINPLWLQGYNVPMEEQLPANAIQIDITARHKIPILGRIAAGLPLYAEQNIEGYTLTDLNGGAEYFALRVNGDSMNAARIEDGDLIIVRRQEEVENGELAVVMVGDDDATVKRFYVANNTVTLMPQSTNSKHQPQIYDLKKTKIRVLGKVIEIKIMAK